MADVFISYARSDKARVAPLVAEVEAQGWSVWWDPEITPGQEFDDQIEAELSAAKAVLVVWTPTSVASRWVRGEAREAAELGILVPVRFDEARLPMDVRAIHTIDLDNWGENPQSSAFQDLLRALGAMVARPRASRPGAVRVGAAASTPESARVCICVLPFANMSGEAEQEYFSDGITEDIITDLSKVSALSVISRNSAFVYKGTHVDVPKVARELKVSHVLEGSVRKAGGRVRISAQLIDGLTNNHVWAERYDRDSNDIFALQDEISEAIVIALKLRLLPEEKKAIVQRGTDNAEAYNLYLMARQTYVGGQEYDVRSAQAIIRLCNRVIEIDPNYAQAWALMALGHQKLHQSQGGMSGRAMVAAERALSLDINLAEAHAIKALILLADDHSDAAASEVAIALGLNPESYEVNRAAGRLNYQLHRQMEAIAFYEKAAALMETDINSASMLIACYTAVGNAEGRQRSALLALTRADKILASDPNNIVVTGYSAYALAALGEAERAKARMDRSLLIDPDDFNMRYNFACTLSVHLHDKQAALDMLGPVFAQISSNFIAYAMVDPDLDLIRDEPRYQAMVAEAQARHAAEAVSIAPVTP